VLQEVARADAETGAEARLDLQAMETLSSIRMNAMGIIDYWSRVLERRRSAETGQAS
jgi:hypothetical protein